MARTLEQIDKELSDATVIRLNCRDALTRPALLSVGERDSMIMRQSIADERIERLLDERSQLTLLQQLAAL